MRDKGPTNEELRRHARSLASPHWARTDPTGRTPARQAPIRHEHSFSVQPTEIGVAYDDAPFHKGDLDRIREGFAVLDRIQAKQDKEHNNTALVVVAVCCVLGLNFVLTLGTIVAGVVYVGLSNGT